MLCFGASVNCIPWVYVPEILPLHARSRGTAFGISSNWLWNFVVVTITPVILSDLQWKAFLIFMCTNLAFVPLVYFCYPETANFTLEEIDSLFTVKGRSATSVARQLRKEGKVGLEKQDESTGSGNDPSLLRKPSTEHEKGGRAILI